MKVAGGMTAGCHEGDWDERRATRDVCTPVTPEGGLAIKCKGN